MSLPGLPSLDLALTATGTLDNLSADFRMATEGQDRLTGDIRHFTEDGETRRFEARLGGDLAPVFSPEYRPFFGPDIQLTASGQRLADGRTELSRLDLAARSITLSGTGALAAGGVPERMELSGRIADPAGTPVLLPVGDSIVVDDVALDIGFDADEGEDWRAEIVTTGWTRPRPARRNCT